MKERFEEMELELIRFGAADILTTSSGDDDNGGVIGGGPSDIEDVDIDE